VSFDRRINHQYSLPRTTRHGYRNSAGRLRQGLQTLQEHHEGEAVCDKVPIPERAPYSAVGARRPYGDVRVLLPVPLKPLDLLRRSEGNLVHGPVSLSGQRSAQWLSGITCYPPSPLRELFFLLRGPSPAGARWRGLLVCAIDGTIMSVAGSAANLAVYSRQRGGRNGDSGYPMLRLLVLVSCGTRTVIDAVFRPISAGETTCARPLLGSLRAGMLLLADRNFAAGFLAAQIAGARADFLIRVRTGNSAPKLPVLRRLADGSWLSRFGGVPVRVIDAEITIATSAGRSTDGCRLITTLTDAARYPAGDLAVLYRE
jgi:Transposase DDE domain